ncbi:hypothetical protein B0H65DRAFT_480350, partial [Neurospora tetraspora]
MRSSEEGHSEHKQRGENGERQSMAEWQNRRRVETQTPAQRVPAFVILNFLLVFPLFSSFSGQGGMSIHIIGLTRSLTLCTAVSAVATARFSLVNKRGS